MKPIILSLARTFIKHHHGHHPVKCIDGCDPKECGQDAFIEAVRESAIKPRPVGESLLRNLPLLAIFLVLMAFSFTAYPSPRMDLLLDVICSYETRGEKDPDSYVGVAGEVGMCAVRISTARMVGFTGTGRDLMNRKTNRMVAQDVLLHCARRVPNTAYRLAICFNAGPWSPIRKSFYAKQIAATYAYEWLRRHGLGIKLAMR